MSGDRYPILVRKFPTPQAALTIVCERCHTEKVINADDLLNEGVYRCPADYERGRTASTEPRCGGSALMKYEPADECPACKKLGFFGGANDPLKGCCSRRCMLQAEYAKSLEDAS